MVGLLDIAPLTEKVPVGDVTLGVTGVTAAGLVAILSRFPEVRMLMTGKEVGADSLMAMGGDAVAAIIAAGTGAPGNAEHEAAAASLPLEFQADILVAIIKVTLPNGIGPFMERMTGLMAGVAAASPKVRASK